MKKSKARAIRDIIFDIVWQRRFKSRRDNDERFIFTQDGNRNGAFIDKQIIKTHNLNLLERNQ